MKRISTLLRFALLLLVGTAIAQHSAACQSLSVTPSTLTFNVTSSPSDQQRYTITNSASSSMSVLVTPSAHSQVLGAHDFQSTPYAITLPAGVSLYIVVRVVTSSPILALDEMILNKGTCDGLNYSNAPVSLNGSAPLPIQLSSFKAVALTGNGVTLNWTTLSEMNNYGFNVQRDGINIGFIKGHGTTLDHLIYSYTDNPGPGEYQYRLQQVDLNGTATLSESILMYVAGKFELSQNYPNPFNPSTQISFSLTKEGPVSLRVYDILGREVATLVKENRKPGQYTERFDGSRLASGVYMYVLQSGDGRLTSRMVLSK